MAAIDCATCGVDDEITHSLKLHPQLLADRLRFHACAHAQFADACGDREVMRNELDLADRLHSFANATDYGDYTIPDDVDVRREAFSCAAGLQNLHPIMQKVIAEREMRGVRVRPEAAEVALSRRQPGAKLPSSCSTTSRSQRCAVSLRRVSCQIM